MSGGVVHLAKADAAAVHGLVASNTPAVIKELFDEEALRSWQLERLVDRVGDCVCRAAVSRQARYEYDPRSGLTVEKMTIRTFAQEAFGPSDREQYYYLQEDLRSVPALIPNCELPASLTQAVVQSKLWVSSEGLITSLHYDPVETYLCQFVGSKRVLLFPPGLDGFYPHGWTTKASFVSRVNPESPDYDRFPAFRPNACHELTLEAGDLLYLPFVWWHQVRSCDPVNISVNYRWFAGATKTLRYLPEYARTLPQIARGLIDKHRHAPQTQA